MLLQDYQSSLIHFMDEEHIDKNHSIFLKHKQIICKSKDNEYILNGDTS